MDEGKRRAGTRDGTRAMDWGVAAQVAGILAAAAVLMWGAYEVFGWSLEDDSGVLWAGAAVAGTGGPLFVAARRRRVLRVGELLGGAAPVLLVALVWLLSSPDRAGLAGPGARALFVAPAILLLTGYFGASLGYLFFAGGRGERRMGYEGMVGRRFLLGKASPVLSTVTTISVVGVLLGVGLVAISLGILGGFENDLQTKIIGANADLLVRRPGGRIFTLEPELLPTLRQQAGVVAAAPFVEGEVAAASSSNYGGALLFGIDPDAGPKTLGILSRLQSGSLDRLRDPGKLSVVGGELVGRPPPLVIGRELAKILNVTLGDRVRIVSPTLEVLTPLGVAPRSISLEVVAIFSSKMYEFDARFAYTDVASARRFFELGADEVSGVHVRGDDPDRAPRLAQLLSAHLPAGLEAVDWQRRNQTLFSALKLERVVAFVVLVFIILVASFSIVNTLTMSIIEKKKAIAILKTMGARDVGIMKTFLTQGLLVGGFGTALGAALAVGLAAMLERFGFWIPSDVYYIDSLPVDLRVTDVVLVSLAALLIVWDFAVAPALRGAELEPVEGLRDG